MEKMANEIINIENVALTENNLNQLNNCIKHINNNMDQLFDLYKQCMWNENDDKEFSIITCCESIFEKLGLFDYDDLNEYNEEERTLVGNLLFGYLKRKINLAIVDSNYKFN